MNRKVMVAAVAAALAAPAAFAQTTVTIGGTINIMWDQVRAKGATRNAAAANFDVHSHDRVRDGNGSNIRFFVGEELGGGNQAFIQVESAVIANSDAALNGWGGRNTAIGIRSKPAGRFLIGRWDVHLDEMYSIESGWLIANSGGSANGLMGGFGSAFSGFAAGPLGAIGGRFSNTIRWDSPQWGGFSLSAAYARPVDAPPPNAQFTGAGGGASVINDANETAWHFAARYLMGGLQVRYSYLQHKDIVNVTAVSFAGATGVLGGVATMTGKITGNRIGVRYRFAMGLGIGAMWDQSRFKTRTDVAGADSGIKRTVWVLPVTYETGNHGFYGSYGRADDWSGNIGPCSVDDNTTAGCASTVINAGLPAGSTFSLGRDTGATFVALAYTYKLSQRTNVHLNYARISNNALARYDYFANTSGTVAANVGADPRSFTVGMRHTF